MLAKTLLYASPEKIIEELVAIQDRLGRYSAALEIGKDGSARLLEATSS